MYDELAFEMQRTQRMRLGEQQSNSPVPFRRQLHVHVRSQGGHSIVAVNAKGQVCPCASAMLPVNKKRKRRPRYDRTLSVDSHPALMSFAQPPPFFIAHFYLERLSGQIWLRRQCGRGVTSKYIRDRFRRFKKGGSNQVHKRQTTRPKNEHVTDLVGREGDDHVELAGTPALAAPEFSPRLGRPGERHGHIVCQRHRE